MIVVKYAVSVYMFLLSFEVLVRPGRPGLL
jgi:hypothetical protein